MNARNGQSKPNLRRKTGQTDGQTDRLTDVRFTVMNAASIIMYMYWYNSMDVYCFHR